MKRLTLESGNFCDICKCSQFNCNGCTEQAKWCDSKKVYERLRELENKLENGELVTPEENTEMQEYSDEIQERINNLGINVIDALEEYKEIKDKLENGMLVELPCKLGDTVWFIKSTFSLVAFPIDSKVVSIRGINCDYEVMYSAITNYNKIDRTFTSADIGKTVFLEKEQAEQKLNELKQIN